ncbi:MAG: hypothetical protein JRI46_03060 [Deltaproteobacteria bacterium]|nr:hypothetical protein [Deltaproteobacteria bacterium]
MAKRISRIVFFLLFFVALIVPSARSEVRHVTILYSNNINGQVNPSG